MQLAIIPARGGSKRIPKKNIKFFRGKPIIAWSILAAKKSNCFKKIVVSTDDDNIAKISMDYGAEVPFIRPPIYSSDEAPITKVLFHAVNWFNKKQEFLKPKLSVMNINLLNEEKILQSKDTQLLIDDKKYLGKFDDNFINSKIY